MDILDGYGWIWMDMDMGELRGGNIWEAGRGSALTCICQFASAAAFSAFGHVCFWAARGCESPVMYSVVQCMKPLE